MPRKYQTSIGSFTRKSTFFWAAVGATVGLANLWQFPYLASQHGGGLFIVLYLACLLLVTLPLMVTETVVGRHSRHGIVLAIAGYVKTAGAHRAWRALGPISIISAFLVLSFTAVFGGIVVAYIFIGAAGEFRGVDESRAAVIFADLVTQPGHYRELMAWHFFFLLLLVLVAGRGVVRGVERAVRFLVPVILVLMAVLFVFAAWYGQLDLGLSAVLEVRPGQLGLDSLRAAFFHAFYTLGLGMGVWTIFGAYAAPGTRLKRSVLAVVLIDTLVAIVAGILMFSIARTGLETAHGFNLLFVSLPVTLAPSPYGQALVAAMFLLVMLVVWSTALALFEPVIGWLREWVGAPRRVAVLMVGAGVWLAGLVSLFSFNLWAGYLPGGMSLFRWLELLAGGVLIPAVGIMLALFTGWCISRRYARGLLGRTAPAVHRYWYWVLKLIVPVAVALIGLQYIVFSLAEACDNGSASIWCGGHPAQVESRPPQNEPTGDTIRYDTRP